MQAIWKYILKEEQAQGIELPYGAKILSAHAQNKDICIYVLVNTKEKKTGYRFIYLYATGDEFYCSNENDLRFIGTVLLKNGIHVFEQSCSS